MRTMSRNPEVLRYTHQWWGEDVRNLYSALRYHDGRLYALFTGDRMHVDEDDAVNQRDCSILVLDCDGVPLESIRMDRLLMRFDIDLRPGICGDLT